MSEKVALITGACGEIGQALVQELAGRGNYRIVTMDLAPLATSIGSLSSEHIQGDLLGKIKYLYDIPLDEIYHLAAFLSSKAELMPEEAHHVNVDGTLQLLQLAAYKSEKRRQAVKFFFPSSIAVYGFSSLAEKQAAGRVTEDKWTHPHTMYGCNKIACESLGVYYSRYLGQRQFEPDAPVMVDFRALRFPGLVSAFTVPSGGTSDYGPEMLHAAARGEPYECFVREDTRIPFMAMPDAIKSIRGLMAAPREKLAQSVYNVTSFSLSAGEFRERTLRDFPEAQIGFAPNPRRQGIVDSWPEDVDDSGARAEWGWQPDYAVERFFDEYLVANIKKRYDKAGAV
jgi:nucleoside-diphosphate-sugar epimerase